MDHEWTIRAGGLQHSFYQDRGTVPVLKSVSLQVRRGEFCLLTGDSGSGKSTLLAILSGLLPPTQGSVTVQGTDLWRLSEPQREAFRLKHFGFVFQGYHLFPALTAQQQLEIVLQWGQKASGREARQRAQEMLELLGLSHRGRQRPSELSGGEKQRVAIGRALVKNPAVCFADEPTSALDARNAGEVTRLLRKAAHELGTTVVVITHDRRMTEQANRIFRLEAGMLQEVGLPGCHEENLFSRTSPVAAAPCRCMTPGRKE